MKISVILFCALAFSISLFSQTYPETEYDYSLKEKKSAKNYITESDLSSSKYQPIKSNIYSLIESGNTNSMMLYKGRKTWRSDDVAKEYLFGTLGGAGLALLGTIIGAVVTAPARGDTAKSKSDENTNVILAFMGVGHTAGVMLGIFNTASKLKVKGNYILSIAGILIGQGAGIYLLTRDDNMKRVGGGFLMLLITPLLGTLGFNTVF